MKTLFVGFSRFGSYRANSSELLVKHLNAIGQVGRKFVATECLPARVDTIDHSRSIFDIAIWDDCSAIVLLGMSSAVRGMRIETTTKNLLDSRYCPHVLNGKPIDPDVPTGKKFKLDLGAWRIDSFLETCRARGIDADLSDDAGGFCCNRIMYLMRKSAESSPLYGMVPWIFAHISCSKECVDDEEEFLRTGKVLVDPRTHVAALSLLVQGVKRTPAKQPA